MKGKTHAGIGAVTFVALYKGLSQNINFVGLVIVILSSLLPDIDHPKGILNRYILPFKNKATKVTLYICLGALVLWVDYLYFRLPIFRAIGLMLIVIALSSHRNGLTHSLVGMILFGLIMGYIGNYYKITFLVYYFVMGYGMHLICDMATNRGVSLFYPFSSKKIKWPVTYSSSSKLGSFIEDVIMIIGLIYIVYRFMLIYNIRFEF